MSKQCSGLVKANPEQVGKALARYLEAYKEAKKIVDELTERSKVDTISRYTWYGRGIQVPIRKIIFEQMSYPWFGTLEDHLIQYYPTEITSKQVNLLNCRKVSEYGNVKVLHTYNPDEVYLTVGQVRWVNCWSEDVE